MYTNVSTFNDDYQNQGSNPVRVSGIIANFVLNASLSIFATLGNTAIIYCVWHNRNLRSPSNILLLGLALCDFGVGTMVQPLYIIYQSFYIANRWKTWVTIMEAFNFLSNMFCCVSFLTTTAVSVDRYLAVHLHLRYQEFVTVRRAAKLLGVLWIAALFLASTVIWNNNITFFAALAVITVCLLTTVIVYVKIYTVMRVHRKAIRDQQNQETSTTLQQTKSALSMFYVCLIHTLCYIPYFVFLILRDGYKVTDFTYLATEFAQTVVFLKSTLNPLLYCWRLRDIRAEVKRTIATFCCKLSNRRVLHAFNVLNRRKLNSTTV